MFDVEFDITPTLAQLQKWITVVEKDVLDDLREFWDGWASPVIIEEIARIFVTEGYGSWPSLSPKYAAYKGKHYPGKTILRRTDAYFKAATRKKEAGNVFISKEDEMTWGIDLGYFASAFGFPYPAVHEDENRGKSTSPRRPVFALAGESVKLQNLLVVALQDYLNKKIESEVTKYF